MTVRKLENPWRVTKGQPKGEVSGGKSEEKWKESVKERKTEECANTEQNRLVFVLLKALQQQQMFLNGIPVQVRSSLLPLSLLFIFRCGIFIL